MSKQEELIEAIKRKQKSKELKRLAQILIKSKYGRLGYVG